MLRRVVSVCFLILVISVTGVAMAQESSGDLSSSLIGVTWQWEHFASGAEAMEVPLPDYTITFADDGTYFGQADCNRIRGSYSTDGSTISILPGATTRAACPPGSLGDDFTRYLTEVATYAFTDDGKLLLELPVDSGTLTFSAQPEPSPALVGVTWQWMHFASGAEEIDVPTPDYTITFADDGTFHALADCNVALGTYTVEGNTIALLPGPTTLVMCSPESLGGRFTLFLSQATTFSLTPADDSSEAALLLELPVDSGTLTFSAQPQVTGTVTYLQRIALPENAIVRVQIQDVSVADAPMTLVGEQVIVTGGAQVPFAFAISYPEAAIRANGRYSVAARITDGDGRLLFITDTIVPVITGDNPTSDIELVLVRVGS